MALNNLINTPFPVSVAKGGTGASSLTSHGILLGNGTGAVAVTAEPSDGQLLVGSTGNAPVLASLTAGTGISITPGAGSITINSTAMAFATVDQTGATVTMAVNTQYINTGTANSEVTYTFPATAAQGSMFRIVGVTGNSGGWVATANTGQTIWVGNAVTTTGGTVTFGDKTDVMTFICTVADTIFVATEGVTAGVTLA